MSKDKQSDGGAVVVSMRKGISKRRFIIGAVIVIVVAGLVIVLLLKNAGSDDPTDRHYASGEVEVLTSEAMTKADSGQAAEAVALLDGRIAAGQLNKADTSYIYMIKARILLLYLNDNEGGLATALEAVKVAPDNPLPYTTVGSAYALAGNGDEAARYYQEALSVYDSGNPEAYASPPRDYYVGLLGGTE